MNLKSEVSAYSTDHLEELADELDDEILEIADANVRRRMSQMRIRRRTITSEDKNTIEEDDEKAVMKNSTGVSNFSVRRSSAISLADQEREILEKVLAKRIESKITRSEPADAPPAVKPESKKKSSNNVSIIFRKKTIYTYLSFAFSNLLLVINIYEYISLLQFEVIPETIKYLASFLIIHLISFYLFILGFIYANESGDLNSFLWAVSTGVLNIIAIGFRTNFQFRYDRLIPNTFYISG